MSALYDVAVIGAGPGGYAAAVRAGELGLRTVCFDPMTNPDDFQVGALGGTCANVGCVPSKALLAASLAYAKANRGLTTFGIAPVEQKPDLEQIQKHRAKTVKDSNRGVAMLFKSAGVEFVAQKVVFKEKGQHGWVVQADDGRFFEARNVVVACGTEPRALPGLEFDEDRVCSNTGALAWTSVPTRLAIIGGGVIGLELGSVWSRLGSEVCVFDMAEALLPMAGSTVSQTALRLLSAQGLAFELGVRIVSVQRIGQGVSVTFERNGQIVTSAFDKVLVAIGRQSVVNGVNPQAVGLNVNPNGTVCIDEFCRTNLEGIWAIGDIVAGPQLAHKATDEGRAVAERIAGHKRPAHLSPVPSVVYCHPEFAWVGMDVEAAIRAGQRVRTGKAVFAHNAMARAIDDTEGFVQLVCEDRSGRLLGAQIVGAAAGDMIATLAAAMAYGATDEDLALVVWPHPGLSESIQDAAHACMRAVAK